MKKKNNVSYRKEKYWLKGGITGLIIAIIAGLGMYLMVWIGSALDNQILSETILIRLIMYLTLFISLTLGLPIMLTQFMICFKSCSYQQQVIIYFSWFVIYTLIGVWIGWIWSNKKRALNGKK